MPASSQRSMPPPAVPLEEDVSTVSGSDDETQMTDNNEPPPSQPSPSQPSTQRQRASKKRTSRAPRTDIKNRFSRPRWTEDQIEYLLESYAAKRASGELENEKSPLMKMIYARLAEELTDLYPPCVFDIKKVSRKLGDLLRNWKAFCAMERDTSGSGYDRVTGFFHTTDENWKKWEQKHAAGAKAIRNHGLKPIDLYYRAFGGNQEVGLTAVEATDPESLRTLRDDEEDPAADEILVQNITGQVPRRHNNPRAFVFVTPSRSSFEICGVTTTEGTETSPSG
ncbi:uncharacterized protein FFMR_04142 [Fusarium fujikuroi]|nr:uncharacterized protein FFMR_01923 [Fusarium fujikuroi]SCO36574.1 uncharacterized protein FFMR_04142 [Fusarium fujikuroi]